MASLHESQQWLAEFKQLFLETPIGENVPYSIFKKVVEFFDKPTYTWDISQSNEVPDEDSPSNEITTEPKTTSFTEQVILAETRHFLWGQFYNRLKSLDFSKGEIFQIVHQPLQLPDFPESELEDFPPHTLIYEACQFNFNEEGNPTIGSFYRIYSINLPNTQNLIYGEGEDFSQYFNYAKQHIPQVKQHVASEEDMFQIITGEWNRNNRKPYPTIAGSRDVNEGLVLYFYWTQHHIFTAELRIDEFQPGKKIPTLKYSPMIYPYPVYYMNAVNFRKFRYLQDLE